ncbi:MAG TPA: HepT-like ribonuclease domain-containing protein [Rhizobiaceae bacterium]|nr:HepT-like ribonuclease domain-containing protein [Rhizobiaceae bacterium]
MKPTVEGRLEHIRDAIADLRDLLAGKSFEDFAKERHTRRAAERYFEIISEASRSIPNDAKARHPEVAWKDVAGIGNVIRHDYHKVKAGPVWEAYRHDLDVLLAAVDSISANLRQK